MYQECADRVEDALLSGQVKPGEFDLLEKKFDIRLERAVDIAAAVPVGKREAELLAMEEGEPILLRERTTWDEKGRPAKWSRAFLKRGLSMSWN